LPAQEIAFPKWRKMRPTRETRLLRKWVPVFRQAFPARPVPAIENRGGQHKRGVAEGILTKKSILCDIDSVINTILSSCVGADSFSVFLEFIGIYEDWIAKKPCLSLFHGMFNAHYKKLHPSCAAH
jgi:hypothetical protein